MATVKEEARELIERLADEASCDDLMYEIYVRKKIAMGLEAAEAGKLIPHDQVKRRLQGA
jgi:predicted transcriptional regulator